MTPKEFFSNVENAEVEMMDNDVTGFEEREGHRYFNLVNKEHNVTIEVEKTEATSSFDPFEYNDDYDICCNVSMITKYFNDEYLSEDIKDSGWYFFRIYIALKDGLTFYIGNRRDPKDIFIGFIYVPEDEDCEDYSLEFAYKEALRSIKEYEAYVKDQNYSVTYYRKGAFGMGYSIYGRDNMMRSVLLSFNKALAKKIAEENDGKTS